MSAMWSSSGLVDGDGNVDYSRYGLKQLREAEATINHARFPKNFANLIAAIETKMAEEAALHTKRAQIPPANPLLISGKSAEVVESEYKEVLFKAKIVTVVAIMMWLPTIISRFIDLEDHIGLDSSIRLWTAGIGLTIYSLFQWLFWKCPNCQKFPGGGWSRQQCKSCDVELRGAFD